MPAAPWIGAIAVASATAVGGAAEPTPAPTVAWASDGNLRVALETHGPNGCYSAGDVHRAAPEGALAVAQAIQVTFRFAVSASAVCTMALVPVRWSVVVEDVPDGTQAVIVYVVDPGQEPPATSAVALALPPRAP